MYVPLQSASGQPSTMTTGGVVAVTASVTGLWEANASDKSCPRKKTIKLNTQKVRFGVEEGRVVGRSIAESTTMLSTCQQTMQVHTKAEPKGGQNFFPFLTATERTRRPEPASLARRSSVALRSL